MKLQIESGASKTTIINKLLVRMPKKTDVRDQSLETNDHGEIKLDFTGQTIDHWQITTIHQGG